MGQEKRWDEAESIQLIRSMIESTRYNLAGDRTIYLLWGYGILIAAVLHYVLDYILGYEHPYVSWLIMPILGIIHFVLISKRVGQRGAITFPERVMAGIWSSIFLAFIALVVAGFGIGWVAVYPMFMLFYGTGSFSTGVLLKNNWLIYGGFASMVLGTFACFQPFQIQLLLLMLAITLSFILPAHSFGKSIDEV